MRCLILLACIVVSLCAGIVLGAIHTAMTRPETVVRTVYEPPRVEIEDCAELASACRARNRSTKVKRRAM